MSSSSAVTVIPKRFCGLRILLVEPDKCSLQHHAHMLLQNLYRVTTTTEASSGLSLIMNGHTYDCVLIDADMFEMDMMEAFLHQVLKHQPHISIILMAASDDIHLRIPKEILESGDVSCLLKPCYPRDICDIWKHICRNRNSFEENVSKEKLNKEDNIPKNVHRKDLAINDATTLGNFTDHQAIDIISQEDHAMFEQVSYQDLFSDDDENDQEDVDEITIKDNNGKTKGKKDKGKKPVIPKRNNDHPVKNDKYPKNKNEKKTRVTWKGELDDKFKVALKELGEQASSTAILKHMNVPGLTRYHVASHLQKYHKKRKNLEACIAALAQVQSFANITSHQYSTQPNNDAPIIQSSSSLLTPPKYNMAGICYMVIDNVMAKLEKAPSLPQLTTTPVNSYADDHANDHSLRVVKNSSFSGQGTENQLIGNDPGNVMTPLGFGETMASDYNLDIDIDCLLSGSDNGNFGDASGSGLGEVQEQYASFEPATEPWVADCGGIGALLDHSHEALAMPDFLPFDSGSGLFPSQDFQVNGENWCPVLPSQDFQVNSESLCSVLPSQDFQVNSESLCPVLPSQNFQVNSESLCPVLPSQDFQVNSESLCPVLPSQDFQVNSESLCPVLPSHDFQVNSESLCPVLPSQDFQVNSESLCPVLPSQDFQVNSESLCPVLPHSTTLFDVENCINQGPNFDPVSFRPASADFSVHEFPTEENASLAQMVQLPVNSTVPLDDSEDGFIENVLSQFDLENVMDLLNDDIEDGNLVNGQCYFQPSWT